MYQFAGLDDSTCILHTPTGAYIPRAPGNADWEAYLEWLAAGNSPSPDPEMAVDKAKARLLLKINNEVNAYIYRHYDAGTQATFNALATSYTLALIDPATPAPAASVIRTKIARIQAVLVWINAALTYYYTVKAQLQAAATQAALGTITWDFSTFDATDPLVTIPEIK